MKKLIALLLALCMVFALAACGEAAAPAVAPTEAPAAEEPAAEEPAAEEPAAEEPAAEEPAAEEPAAEEPAEEPVAVMSYAEFAAAELDTEVAVECFVQAKQSWWDNKATIYAADQDGAYFLYNAACSEEDYARLVPGQKILVKGFKAEWSGEVEIIDAAIEILEGDSFIAEAKDVTALLGTDALAEHQNQLVSFKGMTVAAYDESGAAFAYKNEADKTDDLYFKVAMGDAVYDFCVEYYLCNEETEVYRAVEGLKVGDVVDLEGFLYWYEGPNPHITSVVPHEEAKGEGVMSYAEYAEAELDTEVTIEAYVQAKQSWWDDKVTVYAQDRDGAYFLYNMACSAEDNEKLVPGQKIKVTGFKSEWSGEVEIVDASFELEDGFFLAPTVDVTEYLASEDLVKFQNRKVRFSDLTVEASEIEGDTARYAFLYAWDGSGQEGTDSDLYFKASAGDETYTFVIEYYLCNESTDAYQAVQALKVGDKVDLEGFLYWYNGAQPHITGVTVK